MPCERNIMSPAVCQILISVDTRLLQLTPIDDDIYCKFRFEFPDLAVDVVEETMLKSEDAKMVSINRNLRSNFYTPTLILYLIS